MTSSTQIDLSTSTGLWGAVLRLAGDCTNVGVTARFNELVAVSQLIDQGPVPTADREHQQVVLVMCNPHNPSRYVARPVAEDGTALVGMFGGNYIDSSDVRFREAFGGPVAVHDRFEPRPELPIDNPGPITHRVLRDLRLLDPRQQVEVLHEVIGSLAKAPR